MADPYGGHAGLGAYSAFPPYYATQAGMYAPMGGALGGLGGAEMGARMMPGGLNPQSVSVLGGAPGTVGGPASKGAGKPRGRAKGRGDAKEALLKKKAKAAAAKKKAAKKPKPKKPKKKKPKPKKKPKKPKKKPKKKVPPKKPKLKKKMLTKSGRKRKPKDPDAPKRARTAFNFFLDEFREQYKRENPEAKGVVGVTRAGSERWKTLSDREKSPYERKAQAARDEYNRQKAAYEAKGGARKFKLLKGPPRPPTAYFMFLNDFRAEYKKKHPNVKGIKEMSKEAGERWRNMDDRTKVPFEVKAKAAKQEYEKLKAMSPEERVAAAESSGGRIYDKFM